MPPLPAPKIDPSSEVGAAAQIRRHFALLIADGHLSAGDRLPAVRAVAAQSRVSINTVRAAYGRLEADGLVATRQGVGTTVLPVKLADLATARPGSLGQSTLGVILAGLDPFYLPILQGIVEAADREGAVALIASAGNRPDRAGLAIRQMAARGVGGFIVVSADIGPVPAGVLPVVFVDRPGGAGYGIDLDGEEGGRLLGEHLAGHGHEQVGLVTAPVAWPNMSGLAAGLRRGLEARGSTLTVAEVPGFCVADGRRGLADLLTRPCRPSGVVGAGAMLALGMLEEASARGLQVPRDLAVVGYADADPARFARPAVTMIGFPEREAGVQAATMLGQLLAGRRVSPRRRVLAPELRVRASCGCG